MANFTLQQLTEGIKQRHVGVQNKRLVEKWTRTGLLRGLDDVNRENMSQLLENQASQLLRESNTLGNDAVKGFTSIAFPIVRRVFGGLVANELVSIQPMSLPSGLLFYLDYTYGSNVGGDSSASAYEQGKSIYNNPTGKDIRTGSLATGGQYDLVGSGFSKVHKKASATVGNTTTTLTLGTVAAGAVDNTFTIAAADIGAVGADTGTALTASKVLDHTKIADQKLVQFDSQILDQIQQGTHKYVALILKLANGTNDSSAAVNPFATLGADLSMIKDVSLLLTTAGADGIINSLTAVDAATQSGKNVWNVRRLNQLGTWDGANWVSSPLVEATTSNAAILFICRVNQALSATYALAGDAVHVDFVIGDEFQNSSAETLVVPSFESNLGEQVTASGMGGVAATPVIPEIDIKIESIPVTTATRKLRARWSPELAQDLNAYHSLDAEVELTQILSEQIALEIDREILNDLLTQAQGANFFWSRAPGKFVNKRTGAEIARASTLNPGPAFTGTVREWYETLIETIIDVANEIHRKTLRGSANFIVVSPDVATVLEASVLYRPSYSIDGDGQVASPFTMGAEKIGSLSNRFTVYKDPYFPRNKILVGYKGGSYLETGFVYAPYVPLIVTPTIFAPEDFTPRKGVMTRYGKKMVRADFYGTVTCLDMNII
jgi:hypothetical protein